MNIKISTICTGAPTISSFIVSVNVIVFNCAALWKYNAEIMHDKIYSLECSLGLQ